MKRVCVLLLLLAGAGPTVIAKPNAKEPRLYGHRARAEAREADLAPAGNYRDSGRIVKLLAPAAQAFQQMEGAARLQGVHIVPISGFRSRTYQAMLFERSVRKHGSRRKAARWIAPPGYSHHQTGLALDIGDGDRPECDVSSCFRRTRTFAWLRKNAKRFGFRVTYSPSRPGVIGEPWHWHYEGRDDQPSAPDQSPAGN